MARSSAQRFINILLCHFVPLLNELFKGGVLNPPFPFAWQFDSPKLSVTQIFEYLRGCNGQNFRHIGWRQEPTSTTAVTDADVHGHMFAWLAHESQSIAADSA
jgi:hypothetical protein